MYHLNYNAMKNNFFKVFLPIILMIVIASCTGIKVSTDFDRKADFKKYKTYNFSKEVDKIMSLNDMNRRRLKDAISKEMEAKGFQVSTTPDVLVNAFVKGQAKYTAYANTTSFGGPFMYRGWGNSNTFVDVDKSVMGDGDAINDGKAEAGAFVALFGREERFEDPGAHVRGHAGAGVGDAEDGVGARRVCVEAGETGAWHRAGADGDRATRGHGVAGVNAEVEHDLLDLGLVREKRRQVFLQIELESDGAREGLDQQ